MGTAVFGLAWIGALFVGLRAFAAYENTPGAVDVAPAFWPAESKIPRTNDRATLVMLAHPRCPCTRASIGELAKLMAQVQGKVNAYVLLWKPRDSDANWEDTGLRDSAAQIPGVTILIDPDGMEAQRFGAETSGHTLLFDAAGNRIFSGGITESRGHMGDNAGESAIVSFLTNRSVGQRSTSVFGCSLFDRSKKGAGISCRK